MNKTDSEEDDYGAEGTMSKKENLEAEGVMPQTPLAANPHPSSASALLAEPQLYSFPIHAPQN